MIANPQFGTVVSESGSAYTWAENSHEFRLTPWYNDPVTDTSGEAIYIRDEETGRFWSPSPLPARGQNPYVARHGFGYSMFEYAEDGIATELCVYVATDAPVKFARLKIPNRSGRPRAALGHRLLGIGAGRAARQIADARGDRSSTRSAARSSPAIPTAPSSPTASPSSTAARPIRTVTGDRTEFLGRNGTPANPAAMRRVRLSGRVGAGLDPCAAMQVPRRLEDGQEQEIVFILGAAGSDDQARQLVQRFRGAANAYRALEGVWHYWSRTLGAVHVETPDPAVNFLANGWLLYQTLACRMWARTGFYQSGGAFGFRDQLQDAMALVHAEPRLAARASAARRRPPVPRGRRAALVASARRAAACARISPTIISGCPTRPAAMSPPPAIPACSTSACRSCGPRPLRPDEESNYDLPQISDDVGTLYEHCVRAIDHGLRFGSHGLPLMGCGDWNDGMNLVGQQGKGESVWLAFFLYDVLTQFAELARRRGDAATADRYTHRGRPAARQHRRARLGRRMVSPRLLRRRHAARLGHQPRMPDRFPPAKLVGPLRRRHANGRMARRWKASTAAWSAATPG